MIHKEFVKRKVLLIQSDLHHLGAYSDSTVEEIIENFEKQTIVERLLERIINRALDINQHIASEIITQDDEVPTQYRDTFFLLAGHGIFPKDFCENISKSVGLRNILVHDYDKVNRKELYLSIKECLVEYTKYCEYILNFIERS